MRLPFTVSTNKKFDCVGFGANAVDYLVVVPEYPAFDSKTRLIEYKQSAGGQNASCIVGLQRLGMKTAYCGRFGSDAEGAFGLQSLRDEAIDISFCERIEGARTQIAFIIIDTRDGERTVIWDRDERTSYAIEDAPREFAALGRVLHLDGHDPQACLVMAQAAKQAGAIVSADIDNVYAGCTELLPFVDALITSKEFPQILTGIADERAALVETHARYKCPLVGVTLGERGALIYCEGQFIETPAFQIDARDTTGAGDAFHAGFIYAMLRGEEIEICARTGCAVAALNCRRLGARAGLPTRDELETLLRA